MRLRRNAPSRHQRTPAFSRLASELCGSGPPPLFGQMIDDRLGRALGRVERRPRRLIEAREALLVGVMRHIRRLQPGQIVHAVRLHDAGLDERRRGHATGSQTKMRTPIGSVNAGRRWRVKTPVFTMSIPVLLLNRIAHKSDAPPGPVLANDSLSRLFFR